MFYLLISSDLPFCLAEDEVGISLVEPIKLSLRYYFNSIIKRGVFCVIKVLTDPHFEIPENV